MKHLSLGVLSLVVALSGYAGVSAPQEIPQEFVTIWNSHEASGFEHFFTEDAVWVPVAETRDEGRENIVKDLMVAHTSWAKKTRIQLDESIPVTVRFVRPEVATIFFRMKFLDQQNQPIAGLERAMVVVAVKDSNEWKVSAGQLTKESAPRK